MGEDVYAAAILSTEILVYDQAGIHQGLARNAAPGGELRSRKFDMALCYRTPFRAAWICFGHVFLFVWVCSGMPEALCSRIPSPSIRPSIKSHQAYYYLGILSGAVCLSANLGNKKTINWDSIRLGVL